MSRSWRAWPAAPTTAAPWSTCRLADVQPRRTVAVVWHRHHCHSPIAERFLAELRQWAVEQHG